MSGVMTPLEDLARAVVEAHVRVVESQAVHQSACIALKGAEERLLARLSGHPPCVIPVGGEAVIVSPYVDGTRDRCANRVDIMRIPTDAAPDAESPR